WEVPFVQLVAGFLLLTGLFHFIVGTVFNTRYNTDLQRGINKFRWIEYSITSSVMIVLIGLLFGVNDIGAIILLVGLNMTMNLTGWIMEKVNQYTEKTNWLAFVVGTIPAILMWGVLFMFAFGNSDPSEVPWFVYAIFASYFFFFNLFPVNMFLQYKKVGKWKEYVFGEKVYMFLSLFSKTILAWIVLAGIMQP
ncbi:MAG: heliorhodopsin HeR, partial [Candidatus Woesearchaeota archaeon]